MKRNNKFHQQLNNGKWVLDFNKIDAVGFPINILITERGAQGKGFNSKEFALDMFNKNNERSMWIMNTNTQIENDLPKFIKENSKHNPSKWNSIERVGNQFFKIYYENEIGEKKKMVNGEEKITITEKQIKKYSPFIDLIALSTADSAKGSRDSDYKYLFYDEFNVNTKYIKNQTYLIDNLLQTLNDINKSSEDKQLKMFVFGNNKSLNTPWLVDMGITKIEEEETYIYDENGKPLIFIFVPLIDQNYVEEQFKNDWTYQLGKKTGTAKHSFYNETAFDNINGIKEIDESILKIFPLIATYKIDERYYELYKIQQNQEKPKFHLRYLKEKPYNKNITVVKNSDMEPGFQENKMIRSLWLELLKEDRVTFDSIVSKSSMLDNL